MASHLIGDLTGSTIDDPLSDQYNKLGCKVSPLDKESDDYKMIVNYLEKTYEPVKVGDIVRCQPSDVFNGRFVFVGDSPGDKSIVLLQSYGASVENIYAVESSAAPSYEEIKKLPNKVLLWCGEFVGRVITQPSSLMRISAQASGF